MTRMGVRKMNGFLGSGVLAFLLFIVYDFNEVRWRKRWLHGLFFAGFALLVLASVGLAVQAIHKGLPVWPRRIAGLVLAALFLGLLLYTLFGALPFAQTYQQCDRQDKPMVCRSGVYALCRHPGVLWFAGFYGGLWLALGGQDLLSAAIIFSSLNGLYVFFQDRWTFGQTFADYESYQQTTPFLIPNRQSIGQCLATLHQK